MYPKNVHSLMLYCENQNYILFKCAFHYAESGLKVWFISPESFNDIPANLATPSKDVLKLITFLYLKDCKDLLNHLNSVHMWHKIPNVIILSAFETYSSLHLPTYLLTNSAFLLASLLDASSACATKQKNDAFLLLSCQLESTTEDNRLQILNKMYLQHTVKDQDFENQDDIVNKICELLKANM